MKAQKPYDVKALFKCLGILILLAGIMKATGGSGFAVIVPFFFLFLGRGKDEQAFFLILICAITIITNTAIMPRNFIYFMGQRFLMTMAGLVFFFQAFSRKGSSYLKPLFGIFFYLGFSIISSAAGWNPVTSFLKIFLFSSIFIAYYGAANPLAIKDRPEGIRKLRSIMLAVAIFYLLGSVMLLPFPGISQMKGEEVVLNPNLKSLFKGMTNHSQCLGPVAASLAIILFGDLIFSVRRFDPLYVLLLLCCPVLIYKTSSRTGMATLLICFAILMLFFMRAKGIRIQWRSKIVSTVVSLMGACCLAVLASSNLRDEIQHFIVKWGASADAPVEMTAENVLRSRQKLIDSALENFNESPFIGNGFQVSREMLYSAAGGSSLAKYLSAPVEKGVWIYAVLEEGGVVGMVILCSFAIGCLIKFIKIRAYIGATLLIFLFVSNLAEFSMFSMSYTGGFLWAMIFIGATYDAMRNNEMRRERMTRYYGGF